MPKIRLGGHVINTDAIAHVDRNFRAQHPDRTRWKEIGNMGYTDDALRVQFGHGLEDITLFDDEAQALRDHLDGDADDLTPEKPMGEAPDVDPITAEVDAATAAGSGIIDSERLHAATSAGQDRPGAADLRPPADRTTPPPGASPDAEILVPARTAGLRETPVEAKGVVAAAETVRADDERRAREARERAAAAAERGAAAPLYPGDRSGEGTAGDDKDAPTRLKTGEQAKADQPAPAPDQPASPDVDTGAPKQNLRSLSDAPVVGRPKEERPGGKSGKR